MWTAWTGKNRHADHVQGRDPIPYQQRVGTGAVAPRPQQAGQTQVVKSPPTYPDTSSGGHDSYFAGPKLIAFVKTPLNHNPSYGASINTHYRDGARVRTPALTVAGRGDRRGMLPIKPRQNQTRPDATSYGSMTQRPVNNTSPVAYGSPLARLT